MEPTQKNNFLEKIFHPVPHPNYLYFHMKHLPGWSTTQLLLKSLFQVYIPSITWLTHPWMLALTPFRILNSYFISKKMINNFRKVHNTSNE